MLTIRKKLAEQAASGEKTPASSKGSGLSRRPSFRTQLLTAEANELGGATPSMLNVWQSCICVNAMYGALYRNVQSQFCQSRQVE